MIFPVDDPVWLLLRRSGRGNQLLEAWVEERICEQVLLSDQQQSEIVESFTYSPPLIDSDLVYAATRPIRLSLYKQAAFTLHVEERFSRTKRQRDRLIYSLLRCGSASRVAELALAIREGELDFAAAAIRWSEGPESAQGGRIGPISPEAGHPALNERLAHANEGDLIGPFQVGDMHVLLRLDTRISIRLDEPMQQQLIEELYQEWLQRQVELLANGEMIEPIEYLPE
ncbi:peptidylprolyl isomerase [Synechococcus lacustris C3-12m-Tous]|uniref:peptidylprolyl isomerase n=1 Tax=Synechococcus lacustris TaxID=2116544 RepID=UPI0020CF5992|nr:peptidylprolyl isomerase [Synechococcus lacustris]MCP9925568.1 peptidylprolyl isomerase [Synechococcus lacustris C3-12m-Tous]